MQEDELIRLGLKPEESSSGSDGAKENLGASYFSQPARRLIELPEGVKPSRKEFPQLRDRSVLICEQGNFAKSLTQSVVRLFGMKADSMFLNYPHWHQRMVAGEFESTVVHFVTVVDRSVFDQHLQYILDLQRLEKRVVVTVSSKSSSTSEVKPLLGLARIPIVYRDGERVVHEIARRIARLF